jgi:hypothetical protein
MRGDAVCHAAAAGGREPDVSGVNERDFVFTDIGEAEQAAFAGFLRERSQGQNKQTERNALPKEGHAGLLDERCSARQ